MRRIKTAPTLLACILISTLSGCAMTIDGTPSPSITTDIDFGQSVELVFAELSESEKRQEYALNGHYFRFRGKPGETVTATARSSAPDLSMSLWSHFKLGGFGHSPMFASDFKRSSDPNGRHAEVITTLPEDEDGVYYIAVTSPDAGPLTLSIEQGAAATAELWNTTSVVRGNTGQYMSPFTEDGTVTPWVEASTAIASGASLGRSVGTAAGETLKSAGLVGIALGIAGDAAGRALAVEAVGGWEYVKQTSDTSFHSLEDMAVYLHVHHSDHPQYRQVLRAVYAIYPDLVDSMHFFLHCTPNQCLQL